MSKRLVSLIIIFILAVFSVLVEFGEHIHVKNEFNKYSKEQGLSKAEIKMIKNDIENISQEMTNVMLESIYTYRAKAIIMAYEAKVMHDMKSKGYNDFSNPESRQILNNAIHKAMNSIKIAKYRYNKKNSYHYKFNVNQVKNELGLYLDING